MKPRAKRHDSGSPKAKRKCPHCKEVVGTFVWKWNKDNKSLFVVHGERKARCKGSLRYVK